MEVRPIDAVQVLHNINLHRRPTPVSEFESGFNNGLNQAMWEITHAPTLTQPNEPLTLEQLREMDEIPIYVVTEKYGSGWCVLNWHGMKKSYTYFSRTGTSEGMTATPLSAKTYGDLWIAYRRPPEVEEETP